MDRDLPQGNTSDHHQFDSFKEKEPGPSRFLEICCTTRPVWTQVLSTTTVAWDICQPFGPECWDLFQQNIQSETGDYITNVDPDLIVETLAHNLYDYDEKDTLMMYANRGACAANTANLERGSCN